MSVLLVNTNPLGDVDVPLINRQGDNALRAGEMFGVEEDVAIHLLEQSGNYEIAPEEQWRPPAPAVEETHEDNHDAGSGE